MADVLVVDDDGHIREVVRFSLEQAGHRVTEAASGDEALAKLAQRPFDILVLDIVMPGVDGLDVCRKVRAQSDTPVIFVSSRDDELDTVLGLELGADDYIAKPFSPRELVARVKAVLRRVQIQQQPRAQEPELLNHGSLEMDLGRHRCRWDGREVVLTVTEFALLESLVRAPGRVYSRDQLVDAAYGDGHVISDRTVDSHIRRIRKKLAAVGGDTIETVYGLGYRMRETP